LIYFIRNKTERVYLCSVCLYPQLYVGGSFLIYVICVCLCIVVSNAYWLYQQRDGCLIRSGNWLPFGSTSVLTRFWVRSVLLFLSFLWCVVFFRFVCLRPVSCVPNVASVSGFPPRFSLTFICNLMPIPLLEQISSQELIKIMATWI